MIVMNCRLSINLIIKLERIALAVKLTLQKVLLPISVWALYHFLRDILFSSTVANLCDGVNVCSG